MGNGMFFWGDDKVLKLKIAGGYTTLHALNATELHILKWFAVGHVNFTPIDI